MKIYIEDDPLTTCGFIAYEGLWDFIIGRKSPELSRKYSDEGMPKIAKHHKILGFAVVRK